MAAYRDIGYSASSELLDSITVGLSQFPARDEENHRVLIGFRITRFANGSLAYRKTLRKIDEQIEIQFEFFQPRHGLDL